MTKYEWESELKKNIHRLPEVEIKRAIEYYAELFFDKAEQGYAEADIIAEFGNPVDVADKILGEYMPERNGKAIFEAGEVNYKPKTAVKQDNTERDKVVNEAKDEYSANANKKDEKKLESHVSGGRVVAFIILTVLLGGAFVGIAIAVWAVVLSVLVSGVACIAGGAFMVVPSFIEASANVNVMMVQLGLCLAAVGVGIFLIIVSVKLIKLLAKGTKGTFRLIKNWFVVRRESL